MRLRPAALLLLGVCIGFCSWPAGRLIRSEIRGKSKPELHQRIPLRAYRHVAFMEWAKAHPSCEVVFLGDSITDFWRDNLQLFDERFPGAANFAVVADRIEDVTWGVNAGELDALHPKRIVLLVGVNDLLAGETVDQVVSGISKLVSAVKTRQPAASIVLIGLLPVDYPPLSDPIGNRLVHQVNERLARVEGVYFLDFGSNLLKPDGGFNGDLQPDHLHLSPAGYRLWADQLTLFFARLPA